MLKQSVPADSQASHNEPIASNSSVQFPHITTFIPCTPPLRLSSAGSRLSDDGKGRQSERVSQQIAKKKKKKGQMPPQEANRKLLLKNLLPRIDQGRGSQQHADVLCNQWIASYRREQSAAVDVVETARELFYDTVVRQYVFIPSNGHEQLRLLAVRAAVSCFLLEEIVNSLPRHEDVLRPYVGILVQSVYVPDTPAVRKALGGSIAYTQLFEDIPSVVKSNTGATVRQLLQRYARKPYFVAHHELTQEVIAYSHSNTSQKQHFKRLSSVFALINHNWIKSFLRIVVRAWSCVCKNRRENEQKHRARWAQRFASERIRSSLREWGDIATYRLKRAVAAENIKTQIRSIELSIRDLEDQVSILTSESASLSAQFAAKDDLCVNMEKQIAEREEEYKVKLDHVREMDRVGSQLLDTLLQSMPFPADGEQMPPLELLVLWANTKLVQSVFGPLYLSPTDEEFAEYVESMSSVQGSPGEGGLVSVSDVADAALPFTPLLAESDTVYVPLHRYMALMQIMDPETGPTMEELKLVSVSDRAVWERRSAIEAEVLSSIPREAAASPIKVDAEDEESLAEMEKAVGDRVVSAYKSVTGSVSVVTAEQLLSRQRGPQLIFLATLMRYFANWIESKVKMQQEGITGQSRLHANTRVKGREDMDDKELQVVVERFRGKRHPRYREWCYPPKSHLSWAERVADQRRWIAASFSALHEAVTVARAPHIALSTAEEKAMPTFMANVTLARISDILPAEVMDSPVLFMRIVRCVETPFPRICALFGLYALPFSAPGKPTVLCVLALDFWRMLRDCRVVGGRDKLHRVAVRRIIACVAGGGAGHGGATGKQSSAAGGSPSPARRTRAGGGRGAVEVDLTGSHYRTRLDAAGFTEALLRCAQVWDGMLHRQPRPASPSAPRAPASAKQETQESQVTLSAAEPADALAVDAAKEVPSQGYIHYEQYHFTWTLHPSALQRFFYEWIIPHGFRGPALTAFRRGMRNPALRKRFYASHDALFGIYAGYARPKEAYGMRSGDKSGKSQKHSQFGRVDVGIARVLTLHGLQRMMRDFSWYELRHMSPQVAEDLFSSVSADKSREPGVLFYPEWIDLLCAFSLYCDPDPSRALHEKASYFLDNYVLKHYRGED